MGLISAIIPSGCLSALFSCSCWGESNGIFVGIPTKGLLFISLAQLVNNSRLNFLTERVDSWLPPAGNGKAMARLEKQT